VVRKERGIYLVLNNHPLLLLTHSSPFVCILFPCTLLSSLKCQQNNVLEAEGGLRSNSAYNKDVKSPKPGVRKHSPLLDRCDIFWCLINDYVTV
jgi:hypothetical protein